MRPHTKEYVRLSHFQKLRQRNELMQLFDLRKCMNVKSGVCVTLCDALAETSLLALGRSVCLPSVSLILIDDHG